LVKELKRSITSKRVLERCRLIGKAWRSSFQGSNKQIHVTYLVLMMQFKFLMSTL
jgi:hypothetical protein